MRAVLRRLKGRAVSDLIALRQRLAEWNAAFCSRDVDRLLALYAPEAVVFDAIPPFADNIDSLRAKYTACFPAIPAGVAVDTRDLRLAVGGDLALAHCRWRLAGELPDHPTARTWLRSTLAWQRREGVWLIVHEHWSLPFDPETSQVAYSLEDQS